MAGKKMEGDSNQRRKAARKARAAGKLPSAVGVTLGSSKQPTKARRKMTHQQRVDLKREGKLKMTAAHTPVARPGSRDPKTPTREVHPRLSGRNR